MVSLKSLKTVLFGTAIALPLMGAASAESLDIPAGDLETALNVYTAQTGVPIALSATAASKVRTRGVRGDYGLS